MGKELSRDSRYKLCVFTYVCERVHRCVYVCRYILHNDEVDLQVTWVSQYSIYYIIPEFECLKSCKMS